MLNFDGVDMGSLVVFYQDIQRAQEQIGTTSPEHEARHVKMAIKEMKANAENLPNRHTVMVMCQK